MTYANIRYQHGILEAAKHASICPIFKIRLDSSRKRLTNFKIREIDYKVIYQAYIFAEFQEDIKRITVQYRNNEERYKIH